MPFDHESWAAADDLRGRLQRLALLMRRLEGCGSDSEGRRGHEANDQTQYPFQPRKETEERPQVRLAGQG